MNGFAPVGLKVIKKSNIAVIVLIRVSDFKTGTAVVHPKLKHWELKFLNCLFVFHTLVI